MTRDVIVVPPELTLEAANRLMAKWSIRHLPVVKAGHLAGILSDRDLLRHGDSHATTTCGEAMTPAPFTCTPAAPVARVAQMMLEHKIDSLPVMSEAGALIGLVTSSDLLALLIDRPEVEMLPFEFRLRTAEAEESGASA